MIVLIALALYTAAGIAVAAAFVAFGVTRVLALRARSLAAIFPMRRAHRSLHRVLWPALALAVALGFTMALVLRPPPDTAAATAQELKP